MLPASRDVCAGDPARDTVVGWLYHPARLVRSMECWYTVSQQATTADDAEFVRELAALTSDSSLLASCIYSDEDALARSYSAHWWRKGERERSERYAPITDPHRAASQSTPLTIEAFDGATVRTLRGAGVSATGAINSADRAAWRNSNRLQPWSLLFEYQATPYWQLLKESPDVEVSRDDDGAVRVNFRHPAFLTICALYSSSMRNIALYAAILSHGSNRPRHSGGTKGITSPTMN